jgi:hypothetical protein
MQRDKDSAAKTADELGYRPKQNLFKGDRFGLYDEGEGVTSLYLSPVDLTDLLSCLGPWVEDRIVAILDGSPSLPGGIRLQGGGVIAGAEAVLDLKSPTEAVVFRDTPSPKELNALLPSSLLACPQGALPEILAAEFALIIPDPKNVILLTRDRNLLIKVLSQFLNRKHGSAFPRIEGLPEEEILEYLEPWAWRQVSRSEDGGVQRMAIDTIDQGDQENHTSRLEWVAPLDGGFWRSGWSW